MYHGFDDNVLLAALAILAVDIVQALHALRLGKRASHCMKVHFFVAVIEPREGRREGAVWLMVKRQQEQRRGGNGCHLAAKPSPPIRHSMSGQSPSTSKNTLLLELARERAR